MRWILGEFTVVTLSLKNVNISFGAEQVLKDVSLTLTDDMRLGLVGPNGAGKTTLLRIICGELLADGGTVGLSGGSVVGYLPQETGTGTEATVWQTMLQVFDEAFALEERMRALEHAMEEASADPEQWDRVSREYENVTNAFEKAGGYGYKSAIAGVLKGLGLGEEFYGQPVNTLSGGQRSRLYLARLLLSKPSVLLLDEPTNHLDTEAAGWLENYLKTWQGSVIIVSHDRWFLDQLCAHIGEMLSGEVDMYIGNYTSFAAQRQEKRELAQKAYELGQREYNRQKKIIEQYYAWGRMTGGNNFIKAKSREKLLAKMEFAEKAPTDKRKMSLNLSASGRGGNDVLTAENVGMAFEGCPPLFSGLDLSLKKGDRAALIGPNGIGKTTLLRIIASRLAPAEGQVKYGSGIEAGYYDQLLETLNVKNTVIEEMRDAFPRMTDGELRNTLASFLFCGDDAFKSISSLSGGEKGRLSLLKLMMKKGNLLLLDEPTNHLDMDSREVLEDALIDFDGTVLFISHDRYFINKVATRILEMKDGGLEQYDGNWSDYLEMLERRKQKELEPEDTGLTRTEAAKQKRAEKEREQRIKDAQERVKRIEQAIEAHEARLAKIEALLADPASLTGERLIELSSEHEAVQRSIDASMREWELAQEEAAIPDD
jgi:ATP-binding cassette subfamily F protein 3